MQAAEVNRVFLDIGVEVCGLSGGDIVKYISICVYTNVAI